MKKLLLALIALIPIIAFAQQSSIAYEYDDAGNREKRYVVELPEMTNPLNGGKSNTHTKDTIVKNHEFDINNVRIIVYPNPNGGKFIVEAQSNNKYLDIEIFMHSMNGTLIFSKKLKNQHLDIDISKRENGAYILSIIVGDKKKTITVIKN